MNFNLL